MLDSRAEEKEKKRYKKQQIIYKAYPPVFISSLFQVTRHTGENFLTMSRAHGDYVIAPVA